MVEMILKLKETQIKEFALGKDQTSIGYTKQSNILIDNIAVSRKQPSSSGKRERSMSSET